MTSDRDDHDKAASAAPFSASASAKRVLRLAATGALATLSPDGAPFASLVTVATTPG